MITIKMLTSKEEEVTNSGSWKRKIHDDKEEKQGEEIKNIEGYPNQSEREGLDKAMRILALALRCSVTGKDSKVVWWNFDSIGHQMGADKNTGQIK